MNDPGALPDLRWLPVDRLKPDPRYQRKIESAASQKLIAKIADAFVWHKFQAILTAPADEDGWWYMLDGQHRVAGVIRRGGIPDVPAVVIPELDWQLHAAAFVGANGDRVAVNPFAMHRARLAARDPEAMTIALLAEQAGIIIPGYPVPENQMKPGETNALGAFVRLPARYGPFVAIAALKVVARAYGDEPGGLRAVFFDAAAKVMAERKGLDTDQLVQVLRRTTASALLDEIHLRKGRVGGTLLNAAVAVIGLRLTKAGVVAVITPTVKATAKTSQEQKRLDQRARSVAAQDQITAFMQERGATQCPPGYAGEVRGALSAEEERRRISELKLPKTDDKKKAHAAFIHAAATGR